MKFSARVSAWIFVLGLLVVAILSWRISQGKSRTNPRIENQATLTQTPVRDDAVAAEGAALEMSSPPQMGEGEQWKLRWDEWTHALSSEERNRERAALLRDLARRDAAQAVLLARTETDPDLRQDLFRAALEGWASVDLDAAGEWALQQKDLHHDLAMSAVFNGAGGSPDAVLRFAQQLSQRYPERTQDYGNYLIFSLSQAGAYEKAARYAIEGSSTANPGWITAAYDAWARQEPEVAVLAATDLSDPEQRSTAFRSSIHAWAKVDPKALVDYATGFPEGEEKSFALISGLRAWRQKEPQLVKAWIAKAGPIPGIETVFED